MAQGRKKAGLSLVDAGAPLGARSVVASVLLGTNPPELAIGLLVRTAELFGIAEGTTRVAVSRMVAGGELEAVPVGRYRLAGRLLDRRARQEAGRHPSRSAWVGTWHLAVVTAEKRPPAERVALRTAMAAARLSELREGVWLRPANLPAPVGAPFEACDWLLAHPTGDAATLAARLWDLPAWAARANRLLDELGDAAADLESRSTGALGPSFVLAAAVLRHLTADPLLPDELLPPSWPGDQLRRTYESFEAGFRAVLGAWFRTAAR